MSNISSIPTLSLNTSLWVCEKSSWFQHYSRGVFYDNPLKYTLSVITLQGSLVCFTTACLQMLFTPMGETTFIPQVLGGLLTGPSILGQIKIVKDSIFISKSLYVSEAIALYGTMMFLFLMGVKIDISMVIKTGKRTWAIGVCSCALPIIMSMFYAYVLRQILSPDTDLYKSLFYIAAFSSTGSFQVTASLLEDFKLLNSEVGRFAISASMINGAVSALWQVIAVSRMQRKIYKPKDNHSPWAGLSMIAMVIIILCIFRPIMLWMIRKTPKGKPIKESYIVCIYVMVLVSALLGELVGEHYTIGPMILGLAVPDGPPLGSALVERLDTFTSSLLMPLYFLVSSARFKPQKVDAYGLAIVQPLALFAFFGKVIGTMVPSMYCNMSITDAFTLGLVLGAEGITHLLHLQSLQYLKIIDDQSYAQMFIALIWLTAASTPVIKFLYDPTKSYLSLNRRSTIEHAPPHDVLPLMACLHSEENTPPMMNFLEMSNSTIESPICFYVLHLVQLKGRTAPMLVEHQLDHKSDPHNSRYSQNIVSAFKSYEQQRMSNVMVKLFTSISPYETMHDEICIQAAKKRACMLILPFHMQWTMTGVSETAHPIRALNRHLLRTAPCSVGILIERGKLVNNNPLTSACFYSVGIVFIEGSDDREALAYAMRMADRTNVKVTVIRLMEPRKKNKQFISRDPDGDLIHKFKVDYIHIKRHDYREEVVRDSVEVVDVIRSLEGCFDLVLVGRRHQSESSLFSGLMEWNEYPELGSIGDMLVSSDSTFDGSVLVVQQQNIAGLGFAHHDLHLGSPFVYPKKEPSTIAEVHHDPKIWPIV